ncbi:hypothetical protein TSOC_000207 [Tetrabaena socialis]|uniref:Cyclic nucleotide-binding domain-containing protein n=1 Tax=Tetrabaena socialis TaxID=47790 RepID=A0A2J8AJZ5_9CHLO|nr:hypothetical protein TSOC_000207 [Tetrabaena socialis]|eukprot:PNH12837.1 hypothetical protein TSOC_000207 [Tetrabaena socialis]
MGRGSPEQSSSLLRLQSDFVRKVPEETRMEACFAAKMENFKKDQTVYRIGDPPERFHLILTGVVEIWTHPLGSRREKTLIATLKKGQSFGEMAILNDEPRAEVESLAAKASRRLDSQQRSSGGDIASAVQQAAQQQRLMSLMSPTSSHGGGALTSGGGAGPISRPGSPLRGPSRMAQPASPASRAFAAAAAADAAAAATAAALDGGSLPSPSRPHTSPSPFPSSGVRIAGAGYEEEAREAGLGRGRGGSAVQRSGALTAAGYIWQRMRDLGGRAPPQVRQCLTYDEIAHIKAENLRVLSGGGGGGGPGSPTGRARGPPGPRGSVAGGGALPHPHPHSGGGGLAALDGGASGFVGRSGVAAAAAAAAAVGSEGGGWTAGEPPGMSPAPGAYKPTMLPGGPKEVGSLLEGYSRELSATGAVAHLKDL